MARLGSRANKGFFAMPPHLIPLLAEYIRIEHSDRQRLLDPCCGEGEALALLRDALGVPAENTHGCELDESRAAKAKEHLGEKAVVNACAITELHVAKESVSVLFLNPPYDDDGEGEGRTELRFIRHHTNQLARNGLLILVVPESILDTWQVLKFMPLHYKDLRVLRFPENDYEAFGQVVVLGRLDRYQDAGETERWIQALKTPEVLGQDVGTVYTPATDLAPWAMGVTVLSTAGVLDLANRKNALDHLGQGFLTSRPRAIRCLAEPGEGYIGLMLASGLLDGPIIDPETGNLLVVSGQTARITKTTEETDGDTKITRSLTMSLPRVTALDLTLTVSNRELHLVDFE